MKNVGISPAFWWLPAPMYAGSGSVRWIWKYIKLSLMSSNSGMRAVRSVSTVIFLEQELIWKQNVAGTVELTRRWSVFQGTWSISWRDWGHSEVKTIALWFIIFILHRSKWKEDSGSRSSPRFCFNWLCCRASGCRLSTAKRGRCRPIRVWFYCLCWVIGIDHVLPDAAHELSKAEIRNMIVLRQSIPGVSIAWCCVKSVVRLTISTRLDGCHFQMTNGDIRDCHKKTFSGFGVGIWMQ